MVSTVALSVRVQTIKNKIYIVVLKLFQIDNMLHLLLCWFNMQVLN